MKSNKFSSASAVRFVVHPRAPRVAVQRAATLLGQLAAVQTCEVWHTISP